MLVSIPLVVEIDMVIIVYGYVKKAYGDIKIELTLTNYYIKHYKTPALILECINVTLKRAL